MQTAAAKLYSIHPGDPEYPIALLGGNPPHPPPIRTPAVLRQPLPALFCSNKCPGSAIIRALDLAARLRDANRAVMSGFHTPVEKECLAILLRGKSPIVICPARSLVRFRIPAAWKTGIRDGRLLLLSPFPAHQHRATRENCDQRNQLVAALAADVIVPHATPGGRLDNLTSALELTPPAANPPPSTR